MKHPDLSKASMLTRVAAKLATVGPEAVPLVKILADVTRQAEGRDRINAEDIRLASVALVYMAKAAIEEMRVPTDDMLKEADMVVVANSFANQDPPNLEIWQAMIESALTDEKEPPHAN